MQAPHLWRFLAAVCIRKNASITPNDWSLLSPSGCLSPTCFLSHQVSPPPHVTFPKTRTRSSAESEREQRRRTPPQNSRGGRHRTRAEQRRRPLSPLPSSKQRGRPPSTEQWRLCRRHRAARSSGQSAATVEQHVAAGSLPPSSSG